MAAEISIILPVRDREKSIGNAIQSVLDQDFLDFELIIIDDGSRDNTFAIVKSFEDSRIRVLSLPINVGVSAARNRGVQLSKGRLIAFLDSDDAYFPKKLTKQKKFFEESNASAICCQIAYYQKNGKLSHVKPSLEFGKSVDLKRCLINCDAPPQTWLMTRNAFDTVGGFDDSLRKNEDSDFLIRFLAKIEMRILAEPLVALRRIDSSLSSKRIPRSSFKALENNKSIYLAHAPDVYACKCEQIFFDSLRDLDFKYAWKSLIEEAESSGVKNYWKMTKVIFKKLARVITRFFRS